MGLGTKLSLVLMHLQAAAILTRISVPWPDAFRAVVGLMETLNLDPRYLAALYKFPPITFHVLFLVVANVIPLAAIMLTLLVFQKFLVIIWYFSLLVSVLGIAGSLYLYIMQKSIVSVIFAVVCAIAAILLGVVGFLVYRKNPESMDDDILATRRKRADEVAVFDVRRSLKFISAGGTTTVLAVVFLALGYMDFGASANLLLRLVGFPMAVAALLLMISFVLTLFSSGRRTLQLVREFFESNGLNLLLLVVNTSYTPAVTMCLSLFVCADFRCPAGTVFNPLSSRSPGDPYGTSSSIFCDACTWLDYRCSTADVPPADVCPAFASRRLVSDPDTRCSGGAMPYLFASSTLVMLSFVITVPLLYGFLTRRIVRGVSERAIILPTETDTVDPRFQPPANIFSRSVMEVSPAVSFIFDAYTFRFRYFELLLFGYRVAVVVLGAVLAWYHTLLALILVMVLHLVLGLGIVFFRPFVSPVESYLTISLQGCGVLDTALVIMLQQGMKIPAAVLYVAAGLNVVIPLSVIIVKFRCIRVSVEESARIAATYPRSQSRIELQEKVKEHAAKQMKEIPMDLTPAEEIVLVRQMMMRQRRDREEAGVLHAPLLAEASSEIQARDEGDAEHNILVDVRRPSDLREGIRNHGLAALRPTASVSADAKEDARLANIGLRIMLDRTAAQFVSRVFAASGAALVAAAAITITAYTIEPPKSKFIDASSVLRRTPDVVFGGFDSFSEMSAACCCVAALNPVAAFSSVERWVCPKKDVVVSRPRVSANEVDTGIPIRPLCGNVSSMFSGCSMGLQFGIVKLNCSSAALTELKDEVTEYAEHILF